MSESLFIFEELTLPGVLKITPKVFFDTRGLSSVNYDQELFKSYGVTTDFDFQYFSYSRYGTIRGMHFQKAPFEQNKIVRCTYGKIMDVVFDHNMGSKTFGKHEKVILDMESQAMLYIPGKYAHGFSVLSEDAVVSYQISGQYRPEYAGGVRYNDPSLGIGWPVTDPIVSKQDNSWPLL